MLDVDIHIETDTDIGKVPAWFFSLEARLVNWKKCVHIKYAHAHADLRAYILYNTCVFYLHRHLRRILKDSCVTRIGKQSKTKQPHLSRRLRMWTACVLAPKPPFLHQIVGARGATHQNLDRDCRLESASYNCSVLCNWSKCMVLEDAFGTNCVKDLYRL